MRVSCLSLILLGDEDGLMRISDTTPAEPDAGTAERPLGTVQERPVRLTENA